VSTASRDNAVSNSSFLMCARVGFFTQNGLSFAATQLLVRLKVVMTIQ